MKINALTLKLGFNALGFQTAWWLSVLGLVMDAPLVGPLAMTLYLAIDHFSFTKRQAELLLIFTAMLLGTVVDSLFALTGLISYSGVYPLFPHLAPLWITAMWGGFAATLNHSLAWLRGRPLLGFIMGAVFGPLSYMAGEKFDALQFNLGLAPTVFILGAFWGIAIPLLTHFYTVLERRYDS
ncbi:MAG: DUF2878 domain-containing protein [Candidatus Marinimicrobia bacterium]|nr:DUF2878 domain-containing protein [Candidatus Neomarinimicrobiota bacterium]